MVDEFALDWIEVCIESQWGHLLRLNQLSFTILNSIDVKVLIKLEQLIAYVMLGTYN